MRPFRPFRDKPQWEMSYFEVPADVLEDAEAMTAWARKALRAALAAPPKRAVRKQAPRKRPRTSRSI